MRFHLLLFACLLLFIGCNEEKKEQEELYKEMMDIHDEVMPQMSTLKKLAKTLEKQAESISVDSTMIDSVRVSELKEAASKLKQANESMMEWMHQFNQIEDGTPHGEVIQYLKEQKNRISKVRDDMLSSKKEGEKYIME